MGLMKLTPGTPVIANTDGFTSYWEYVSPQPVDVGFPEEEQHRCACGATRWFS